MDVIEAIESRRSVRSYTDTRLMREQVERLLETAVLAPNHRMTEPWGFTVLGPNSQLEYAELRAGFKAQRVAQPEVRERVHEKVKGQILGVPVLVAVTVAQDPDPITREEDVAATWMAVQNILLAATGMGLGGYIHTGKILDKEPLRRILEVPEDRRVLTILDLGEPAEVPDAKPRTPAPEKTTWLD